MLQVYKADRVQDINGTKIKWPLNINIENVHGAFVGKTTLINNVEKKLCAYVRFF